MVGSQVPDQDHSRELGPRSRSYSGLGLGSDVGSRVSGRGRKCAIGGYSLVIHIL